MENQNRALAVAPAQRHAPVAAPPLPTIAELKEIALAFSRSGFFADSRDAAQAFTKMVAGREMGIGPMAAMTQIFIIKEKVAMSATLIAGAIKRSGTYQYRIVQHDNTTCKLEFFEGGVSVGFSEFSMSDAVKADLSASAMYKKFSRNMLFSRALTNGARWYAPDVFGGSSVYTVDELEPNVQVSASGEPIYQDKNALPAPKPEGAKRKPLATKELKALYDELVAKGAVAAGLTLGAWLESTGVAPGLSARIDEVTGRRIGMTPEETLAAEDALRAALDAAPAPAPESPAAAGEINDDAPRTSAEEAQLAFAAESGADTGGNYAPPGSTQHRRIMAMFTKRSKRLREHYAHNPALKLADDRRHAFAIDVLRNPAKGSSSSWNAEEYRLVSNALEMLLPDDADTEPTQ